jgi:hypothetical protein
MHAACWVRVAVILRLLFFLCTPYPLFAELLLHDLKKMKGKKKKIFGWRYITLAYVLLTT